MSHSNSFPRPTEHPGPLALPGLYGAYEHEGQVASNGSLSAWNDLSSGGNDLSPKTTEPTREPNRFNGLQGQRADRALEIAVPRAFTHPLSVWFTIYSEAAETGSTYIWGNGSNVGIRVQADGRIQIRSDANSRTVALAGAIPDDKKCLVGVFWDGSGNHTAEVTDEDGNFTEHDEAGGTTSPISLAGRIGHDTVGASSYVGAVWVFEADQTNDDYAKMTMRHQLERYLQPSFGWVGMSNSRDIMLGYFDSRVAGHKSWETLTNYAGRTMGEWAAAIADPIDDQPWISFNGLTNTYPDTQKLFFQIAPLAEEEAPLFQEFIDNFELVLAEARRILGKGDVPTYLIPMPVYDQGRGKATCTRSKANIAITYDLIDWAVENATNCFRGPITRPIDSRRERDGSPCHANDQVFQEDGLVIRGFLGGG